MRWDFHNLVERTAEILEIRCISTELNGYICDLDLRMHLLFDAESGKGGKVEDRGKGWKGASK
jgi:hypothetical protein